MRTGCSWRRPTSLTRCWASTRPHRANRLQTVMRLIENFVLLAHNGGGRVRPPATEPGCPPSRLWRFGGQVGRSPTSVRYAAPDESVVLVAHNGGAHGAPARERRGVLGPRKRPSRGVGRSPT